MGSVDLSRLSIVAAAAGLRAGSFTAADLTDACLARIDAVDPALRAFITVTADRARGDARRADDELGRGVDRGPLHGIPLAHKDLYLTEGIRTTCHSRVLEHWIPDSTGTPVARLEAAGSVLLGKLGMHEFAFGGPALDGPFPPVRNPWNLAHIPGGSSSGSAAAVAAGLAFGALGSDTAGSIRTPSSHCNIVGLKPTYGRVSRHGVVPLSWSLDHVGPMARTVEDAAIMLQALAGHDSADPASADIGVPDYRSGMDAGIEGMRIGVPRAAYFEEGRGIVPATLEVFDRALATLEALGGKIIELDGSPFAGARKANQTILLAEALSFHQDTLRRTPDMFGAALRKRLHEAAVLTAVDYLAAVRARRALATEITGAFARVDVVVTPTAPRPPEAFDAIDPDEQQRRPHLAAPANLAGIPAISVPAGFTSDGLPAGLQVMAPAFAEATCFRVAWAFEQATRWHEHQPPI